MLVALLIILLVTSGGTILTYLYEREDSLLPRIAAGNIVGSTAFGLICFLIACGFGFSTAAILISLFITLLFSLLLVSENIRRSFLADLDRAKEKLENINLRKIGGLFYYLFFLILFYFFFNRVMIETAQGIFTGGSQNLGDLPFHLGTIFSFTEGGNVPPENPSFAFAKFTYPFMTDFVAACFVKLGASAASAMLVQNISLALSCVVLFKRFTVALTKNKLAGKVAPLIFLFSGGLGFLLFFRDWWHDGRGFFEFVWNLQKDYTIRQENFRWGNPLVTLFMTQRSLLLGMPIALIVLTKLWKTFTNYELRITNYEATAEDESLRTKNEEQRTKVKEQNSQFSVLSSQFLLGLLAGTLPLVHVHSLIALFIVTTFLFIFRLQKWREWIAFGVGVAIVAVPELVWAMTGSATNLSKFIEPFFGWDKRENNFFVFWGINLGLFIPLLMTALFFLYRDKRRATSDESVDFENEIGESEAEKAKNKKNEANDKNDEFKEPHNSSIVSRLSSLLLFYIPFAFLFLISNIFKLAPWEWDNIKILIYWFVGSVPLVAMLLARLWERNFEFKMLAAGCFVMLSLSGAIDVWRVVSKQINYQVFSRDAVNIAEQIKQKAPPRALFLNAPTYNSAVALAGRRSLMRYSGHLSSYGIDYAPREMEVERIYEGTALADSLLKENNIDYIVVSPEETSNLKIVNEAFFSKFPIVAESGAYRIYQVK